MLPIDTEHNGEHYRRVVLEIMRREHSEAMARSEVVHREHWELIRDNLRDRIIAGELAPGSRLTETALASHYSVSTGPVRTALMSLVQLGLATSAPRKGTEVVTFDRQDVDEIYDVIEALEHMAAEEVALRMDGSISETLRERLEALDDAQSSGDTIGAVHADLEFHRAICQQSGNRRLLGLWEQLAEQALLIIAATTRFKPSTAEAISAHMPIVTALESKDPQMAGDAIGRHFKEAHAVLSTLSDDELSAALGRSDRTHPPSVDILT